MVRSWAYLFVLLCLIQGIHATVNPKEPFIAVHCQISSPSKKIFISQLGNEPLDFSTEIDRGAYGLNGLSYHPVQEKFYISEGRGTFSVDFDGSNEIHVDSKITSDELAINVQENKIVSSPMTTTIDYYTLALEDKITLSNGPGANDIESYGSRLLTSNTKLAGIDSYDAISGTSLGEETYTLPTGVQSFDIDVEAGLLYYMEAESSPIVLYRLAVNDYNGTCIEKILDTTELHGGNKLAPENNYAPKKMAQHGDYVYVAGRTITDQNSGLVRIDKNTGDITDAGTSFPEDPYSCDFIYIHDPAQVAAEENFAGAADQLAPGNAASNASITIPFTVREAFYRGMIADLVIPIQGQLADWRLEISFPRQVFELEIEGCSAEVLSKDTREYGRRKGTDYVVVPTEESRSPPAGDLKITMIAKTSRKVRNMKRPISVVFFPIPVEPVELQCYTPPPPPPLP